MAAAKRLSPEQIVVKLREAERLQGQGATIQQVCKKIGCAEQTFGALAAVAARLRPPRLQSARRLMPRHRQLPRRPEGRPRSLHHFRGRDHSVGYFAQIRDAGGHKAGTNPPCGPSSSQHRSAQKPLHCRKK